MNSIFDFAKFLFEKEMKEKGLILDGVFTGEHLLPDDYPVFCDYFYVCDAKAVRSPLQGNVGDLKKELDVAEVRLCNMQARNLF